MSMTAEDSVTEFSGECELLAHLYNKTARLAMFIPCIDQQEALTIFQRMHALDRRSNPSFTHHSSTHRLQ